MQQLTPFQFEALTSNDEILNLYRKVSAKAKSDPSWSTDFVLATYKAFMEAVCEHTRDKYGEFIVVDEIYALVKERKFGEALEKASQS